MKRWAVLIVFAYALVLLALAAPALFICLGNWRDKSGNITFAGAFSIYAAWGFWIWLGVLALCQALLLLVPVNVAERRLPARRRLLAPILTASFLLSALFISGIFSALCAIFRDNAFNTFEFINKLGGVNPQNQAASDFNRWLALIAIVVIFWSVWGVIFYRFARTDDPNAAVKRATRWLLRGSVLELLVAVPSHIIVRHRDDCCAPFGTFWGITTGISVMLLGFGPGVYFLFAERMERTRPKSPAPPVSSAVG